MHKKPQNIDELISYLTAHPHVDFSHEYNGRTIWRESRRFTKFCNNKLFWTDPLMETKFTPITPYYFAKSEDAINIEFFSDRFIMSWNKVEEDTSSRFVFHYKD